MYEGTFPHERYAKTLDFLKKNVPQQTTVLDLGVSNPFSEIMEREGFTVENTEGQDLDFDQRQLRDSQAEICTAFEIFEHLLNPFTILQHLQPSRLVVTIPLRLWFSPAYRSKTDLWDRHYHEFEAWQFDWLLEKTGWVIKDRLQWAHPVNKIGIRPLLRKFTPRYYAVYAERV